MSEVGRLEGALTPIRSGVTPAAGGRLSRARMAALRAELRRLDAARRRAWIAAKSEGVQA